MIMIKLRAVVSREMQESRKWRDTVSDKEKVGFLQELFGKCGKHRSVPSRMDIFTNQQTTAVIAYLYQTPSV